MAAWVGEAGLWTPTRRARPCLRPARTSVACARWWVGGRVTAAGGCWAGVLGRPRRRNPSPVRPSLGAQAGLENDPAPPPPPPAPAWRSRPSDSLLDGAGGGVARSPERASDVSLRVATGVICAPRQRASPLAGPALSSPAWTWPPGVSGRRGISLPERPGPGATACFSPPGPPAAARRRRESPSRWSAQGWQARGSCCPRAVPPAPSDS